MASGGVCLSEGQEHCTTGTGRKEEPDTGRCDGSGGGGEVRRLLLNRSDSLSAISSKVFSPE